MSAWSEVRSELEALLELDPSERSTRLEELRGRDPALGAELDSLLAHDRAAERRAGFLEAASGPPSEAPDAASAGGGRCVGPYELLREIGSGGMGVVHLARRADGAFERRVALKLIQRGLGDERVMERFRRERQVLANLEHPGIARLIDGGAHQGTPYLVMEYVEGRPIDRYCDAERLPVRARLELFLGVCEAVQHAHHHLVVHRDLKPRNILVTARGEPKLLDFGIAKVLDPEKSSAAPEVTVGAARFLTPAYASPEQVAGRPVTTSSDVYSLGVVLYQLLTGELPYSVETTSAAELERIVCETDARRPSSLLAGLRPDEAAKRAHERLTTSRALTRTLTGDLDRIVLAALRKEPRLRYASVEKLADDLRRHLAGLPVAARPDTFVYRSSRFVRRHRAGVSAAALVLVALVVALVASLSQYRRAETAWAAEREHRALAEERLEDSQRLARALADEEAEARARLTELERLNVALEDQRALTQERFDEVQDFATRLIFDLHEALFPIEGTVAARALLVSTGLAHLDRLASQAAGDQPLQRKLAHAYLKLAAIQGAVGEANLGQLQEGHRSADRAVALARELLRAAPDARHATLLVQALSIRSGLALGEGQESAAIEDLRAARAVCAEVPDGGLARLNIESFVDVRLGGLLHGQGRYEEARALLQECEGLVAAMARLGKDTREDHAMLQAELARVAHALGEREEALQRFLEALEGVQDLVEEQPAQPVLRRGLHSVRTMFASALTLDGDLRGAALLLEANRDALREQIAEQPAEYQGPQDLLLTTQSLMRVRKLEEDWPAMLRLGAEDLPLARSLVERAPDGLLAREYLAKLLLDLGLAHGRLRQGLEAGTRLTEAREILEDLVSRPGSAFSTRRHLANVYVELGRAHRDTGPSGPGDGEAVDRERALTSASEWFERALEVLGGLERDGLQPEELGTSEVREELARARRDLATRLSERSG